MLNEWNVFCDIPILYRNSNLIAEHYLSQTHKLFKIYTADLQGSSVVIARVKRFKFNQVNIILKTLPKSFFGNKISLLKYSVQKKILHLRPSQYSLLDFPISPSGSFTSWSQERPFRRSSAFSFLCRPL